ncbi:MAG: hypothetical protein MUC96_12200 [Myxococcaceae bacterium]|jgi:hypothetical protein|nr:hypothetical protein [Myxococcaceae bacterium]
MRLFPWVLSASLVACVGPEAPDAAVCQDVVKRLCLGPICQGVTSRLSVEAMTCEETLLTRTGCGRDSFAFTQPSRVQFLDCRVPLLRQGASQAVKPSCADVDELFLDCPDVVRFFGGTP